AKQVAERGGALNGNAQALGQELREDGTDGGAEHDVKPTGDHREYDVEGNGETGDGIRPDVHLVLREHGTAEGAHRRGERGDLQLFPGHIDADRSGSIFILAGGIERVSIHAAIDAPPDV